MKKLLLLAILLGGCAETTVIYRNERNPKAVLHRDQEYCEDWASFRMGMLNRSYRSWYIACLKDRGWQTEVWVLPSAVE